MATNREVLIQNKHIDGKKHSATEVLLHNLHTLMSLYELLVPMGSLASTSANHFAAV